jgi:tRNA (mo5U34)-methyltransferase
VTALDVEGPEHMDWPPRLRAAGRVEAVGEGGRRRFEIAARALGSAVERVPLSVYDATPERLGGRFDLVFCGSVLVHLRDPMLALERMAALCGGRLVLAEEYSRRLEWIAGLAAAEFRGESAWMTWWRPASRAWESMVRCAGFEDVRRHSRFRLAFRAQRGGVPHAVIHARGPDA